MRVSANIHIVLVLILIASISPCLPAQTAQPQGQDKGAQKNEQPVDRVDVLNKELRVAVVQGKKERIEELIARGANVNSKDSRALHIAANRGYKEVVQLLLAHRANIDIKDYRGQTPLHRAAEKGHLDVVQLLLKSGADRNNKDRNDHTPMDLAQRSEHIGVVELLRTSMQISQSTQLFFAAVQTGEVEQVKALLAKGEDPSAEDESGRSPIHYALAGKNQDILLFLIAKAIQPNSFEYKQLHNIERLLAQARDVNAKGPNDDTLLHFAAQTGYLHIAALLIGMGADIDAMNESGRTPSQVARSHHNMGIAVLIRDSQNGTFPTMDQEKLVHWLHALDVAPNVKGGGNHDISVAHMTASSDCVQGDSVPITVTTRNRGNDREVFETTLVDVVDNSRLATSSTVLGGSFEGNIRDTADLVFDPESTNVKEFGTWVCIGGDVNGDGFADILICAPRCQDDRGRAYLYYGGKHMDSRADVVFIGENAGGRLGNQSGVFGDVNNDGYDDVIIGVPGATWNDKTDGYVNVYCGGPGMDSNPDIILKGEVGSGEHLGLMVTTGDIDNDGYTDILAGAQGYDSLRGRVYLFWGGDPFDTMPDVVFEGEEANSLFGRRIDVGGDINGDGYTDVLIGARQWGDNECGRAYLFLGNARERIDAIYDYTFTGRGEICHMGSSLDIFDIDNDGIDDVILGARHAVNARGQVYVYWGAKEFDASCPGVILDGQENSAMGGDMIECGHFNDDSYGDILAGAWRYPDWMYSHGRAYLFHGNSRDMMDTNCDHVFDGEGGTRDFFGCQLAIGDVNNDGCTDAFISACYGNHGIGKGYLYYGPFYSATNITFHWDTTNASIGNHTLKVEIPPVPGERNTEDNFKTVTIEVKEPQK